MWPSNSDRIGAAQIVLDRAARYPQRVQRSAAAFPRRRARLPRNLAAVEDRMHELSFGNRLRQDQDNARRINALVGNDR
jgi:hypothetical protein